jgi:fatty-acyl-CoA synthase
MQFIEDTIGVYLEKVVANDPDREFIVYPDRDLRFTYKEFNERVNILAKGLLAIGIEKGDHVGIWAKNVPDWLTFMFATAKIGAVLVTVNTAYKSHEAEYVIKQSDMKALAIIDGFRDVDYISIMYELVPELKTQPRGKLQSARFPYLKNVIYIGPEKHRGMYNTSELLLLGKHGDDEKLRRIMESINCDDVVNMQ